MYNNCMYSYINIIYLLLYNMEFTVLKNKSHHKPWVAYTVCFQSEIATLQRV